jgi:hypothetical protein
MEPIFIIITGIFSRLIFHPANMTAVGALALYSGSRYPTWKAALILFATMIVTDGIYGFHAVMWATYGSLFLTIIFGKALTKNKNVVIIGGISLLSSILFFLITNFAVWVTGSMYPKTMSGLISCYVMALPFFRNSVIGDLGYTYVYFYVFNYYMLIVRKYFTDSLLLRRS